MGIRRCGLAHALTVVDCLMRACDAGSDGSALSLGPEKNILKNITRTRTLRQGLKGTPRAHYVECQLCTRLQEFEAHAFTPALTNDVLIKLYGCTSMHSMAAFVWVPVCLSQYVCSIMQDGTAK